jgi:hypothetical protein
MTNIKASTRFDEPVTQESLDQAIVNGRKRTATGVRATAVQYAPQFGALLFSFEDRSAVALPVNNYPELAALNETDLQSLTLGFCGSALCLDTHDLHISLAGMLAASQPLMNMAASLIAVRNGQKSSAIKSAAARENGRKGGRPKLVLAL